MSNEILTVEGKVSVASAYGTDLTVTAVTKSATPEVTYTGTDPSDGDLVVFTVTAGMTELDGFIGRVDSVDANANTCTLEGIDTTGFATFTAGTLKKVSTWTPAADVRTVSMSDNAPPTIDITRMSDRRQRQRLGRAAAQTVTLNCILVPASPSLLVMQAAEAAGDDIAVKIEFKTGETVLFYGQPSIGAPIMSDNEPVNHNWTFALANDSAVLA